MRIVCPECGGDGYTERIRGDQAFDRRMCEECGGDGWLEDTSSEELLSIVEEMQSLLNDMDDVHDARFDAGEKVQHYMNILSDVLADMTDLLRKRMK